MFHGCIVLNEPQREKYRLVKEVIHLVAKSTMIKPSRTRDLCEAICRSTLRFRLNRTAGTNLVRWKYQYVIMQLADKLSRSELHALERDPQQPIKRHSQLVSDATRATQALRSETTRSFLLSLGPPRYRSSYLYGQGVRTQDGSVQRMNFSDRCTATL
jgi:hypothetical protein